MADIFSNVALTTDELVALYGNCQHCKVGKPFISLVGEYKAAICDNPMCHGVIKNLGKGTNEPVTTKKKIKKIEPIRKPTTRQTNYSGVPEFGKVYNEDCLETMARMPDEFIDLTVTSPPYDDLRVYQGISFNYKKTLSELYRVTKVGGVVIWIVNDQTLDYILWNKKKQNDSEFEAEAPGETLTSFRQAIFAQEAGFWMWDVMLYTKQSPAYPATDESKRYSQMFEYMFVFSKGEPKVIHLLRDKENKTAGLKNARGTAQELSIRYNIWQYNTGTTEKGKDMLTTRHPAAFPDKLPYDHIQTWSDEGDIVYDPFLGSGTTSKAAKILNRKWIGSEISTKYIDEIINEKINFIDFQQA